MSEEESDRDFKRSKTSEETERGWGEIHRLVEEQSVKEKVCKLEVEELKKKAQEKDELIASKDWDIRRLLEEQCTNNEACKTTVEELKKNAQENDELIARKDDTILKLLLEQSVKDEASKVEIEYLKKKNEEMLELLASINKNICSTVKVECAKKEEPKDQPVNAEPQKKRVKVFHYTTTMGLEGTTKEGVVRKSDKGLTEGVYLTSLDPTFYSREEVAQNIYGSPTTMGLEVAQNIYGNPTWQERLATGNLDCWLEVQVEESRLSRCSIGRKVFILLEDLQLEEGRWRTGQTPQTLDTECINLKVVGPDQDSTEINLRMKQTTQMGKLMKAYSERVGVPVTSFAFLFDGRRINYDDTPKELGMKQDDIIESYTRN